MIESASFPSPLSSWDPHESSGSPFFLEIYGETSPVLDMQYAEVVAAGSSDDAVQSQAASPVYEYWWTLGHGGHNPHGSGLMHRAFGDPEPFNPWAHLKDVEGAVARVYFFFPLSGNWRIKELVATIKYLTQHSHLRLNALTAQTQPRSGCLWVPGERSHAFFLTRWFNISYFLRLIVTAL
jgi:hypothetical protein